MMGTKSFFVFVFQILLLRMFASIPFVSSNEICIRGYIMDTFCIERGTLFDNPTVKTLVNPEKHSAHCLLDVPECIVSYEIIKSPTKVGGTYSRWYKLDAKGLALAITYGKNIGKGCEGCKGTITNGIIATVRGKVLAGSASPPVLTVTSVDNSTCQSVAKPVAKPVTKPRAKPVTMPRRKPVTMPRRKPVPKTRA